MGLQCVWFSTFQIPYTASIPFSFVVHKMEMCQEFRKKVMETTGTTFRSKYKLVVFGWGLNRPQDKLI
jgi:hypothetical protein